MRTLVARRSVAMGLLALLLAGCTAANQGAAKGGIIGATGGALIGAAAGGNDARNMGLGALIGGLGPLAGEVIQNRQAAAAPVPSRRRRRPAAAARTVVRRDLSAAAASRGPPARRASPGRRTRPWA